MDGTDYLKRMRVFVAYPSDLARERRQLNSVIPDLHQVAGNCGVAVELVDWRNVVGNAGRPEQVILDQVHPETWDVFIGMLWYRFGTPTGAKDPATGAEFLSGTEEEFRLAYRLWKRFKRPRVLFYRCTRNPRIMDIDPEQFRRVKQFFDEFAAKREHQGLYQTFTNATEFTRLVRANLETILFETKNRASAATRPASRRQRGRTNGGRPTPIHEEPFASLVLRGIKEMYYRALDEHMGACPSVRINVMVPNAQRRLEMRFVDDPKYYSKRERAKSWELGEGKCGTAWQEEAQQIYVHDATRPDELLEPMQADHKEMFTLQSVLSTPVRHNGKVIGVLNLDSPSDGSVTKIKDRKVSALLANLAGRISPLLVKRGRPGL